MEIYIHIPFCAKKCAYCDFNSYACVCDDTVAAYLNALKREIRMASEKYSGAKIRTLYIGGGTPSLLPAESITGIVRTVKDCFDCDIIEATVECNPDSVSEEKLLAYRASGIDRLSMGVQSLDDNNLASIGRIHNSSEAREKLKLAARIFEKVSADLIVGLPYDTADIVKSEADELGKVAGHISVYELSVEEGTPLFDRVNEGGVLLPDDDETAELFDVARDALYQNGFVRYEVSNFAKEGMISQHNYGYWTREEYLGFGAGAHSFVKTADGITALANQIRFASARDLNAYIAGVNCADGYDNIPRTDISVLFASDRLSEAIMLGLRTAEGIDERLLKDRDLSRYEGFFTRKNGKIAFNDAGMSVMNGILAEIV